jgi:peptide/nickel transport system substrate-binding protein
MKRRALSLIMCIIMVCGMFVACSGKNATGNNNTNKQTAKDITAAAEKQKYYDEESVLNLMWYGPDGTDVLQSPWANYGGLHQAMLFESMVRRKPDASGYVPYLATEWDVSKDGLTYTFTVREDSKWHDGTPLTMDDVLFSFNGILKRPKGCAAVLHQIVGAQDVISGKADTASGITVKGNKLIITLEAPRSDFMTAIPSLAILPKHLLGKIDPNDLEKHEPYWTHPIGSGPYKFDEIVAPNYFSIVRNEDYPKYKANIAKVVFTSFAAGGSEAMSSSFVAGNLDFAMGSIANDISNAKNIVANNPGIGYKILPSSYTRSFSFNLTGSSDGKWNDDVLKPEVRQALNLLLDKKAIADMYSGQAEVMTTFISSNSPDYNTDIPLFERDVVTAKKMLQDANFDFSRPIRISYTYTDQTTKDIMDLITRNFAEAGVECKTSLITGETVKQIYDVRNYDMMYVALSSGQPDPVIGCYQNFTSNSYNMNKVQESVVEYKKENYNHLYDEYLATTDEVRRAEIVKEFQAKAIEDALYIPVYVLNRVVIFNEAKFSFPENQFGIDVLYDQDWKYDRWHLLE